MGWGPENSGERLFEQDALARRKSDLDAAMTMSNLAMQPDKARLARSHADLYEAQAGRYKRETASAERLENAVSGVDLSEDPMERLYELSTLAAGAGDIKTAALMVEKTGQLALRGAQAERARAQRELAQVQSAVKKQDFIANRVSGAVDQNSFNAINQAYEQEFGEASPYRGMPFSKQLVDQIGNSALTAKQRLDVELKRVEERGRQAGRGIMDRHNRATEDIARERNRIALERATAVKKAGGNAGTPGLRDIEASSAVLGEHVPDLKGEDKSRAARDIASRAKEIRGQNRAIGMSQAVQMAFKEFNETGAFEKGGGVDLPLVGNVGASMKYKSGGMSRETAIPLPKERKELKKNRYYLTGRGLARWNGEAFDAATEDEEDDD